MSSKREQEPSCRPTPWDDAESFEEWLAQDRAFHDEMRRRFYAGRAKALVARERLRELARRR
jgi:heme-degrading monooxygenase HmoA